MLAAEQRAPQKQLAWFLPDLNSKVRIPGQSPVLPIIIPAFLLPEVQTPVCQSLHYTRWICQVEWCCLGCPWCMLETSNGQELEGQRFFFALIAEPLTSQALNCYFREIQKDLGIFANLTLSSTFFCFIELDENVLRSNAGYANNFSAEPRYWKSRTHMCNLQFHCLKSKLNSAGISFYDN